MADKQSEKNVKKIDVFVDSELMNLIPEFLENRQKDLSIIEEAFEKKDYETLKMIANNLKGSGGSYGFEAITEFGNAIEHAINEDNVDALKMLIRNYRSYLEHVQVKELSSKKVCANCGNIFSSEETDVKYCPQCIVEKQERIIEKSEVKKEVKKGIDRKKITLFIAVLLIIAAIVLLVIKVPVIFEESKPGKPIRIGTYTTDERTDNCIKNLWQISRLFQENKKPDNTLICPASGKPYRYETDKASCPNPEKHGLKALFVTKEKKIPEAIK